MFPLGYLAEMLSTMIEREERPSAGSRVANPTQRHSLRRPEADEAARHCAVSDVLISSPRTVLVEFLHRDIAVTADCAGHEVRLTPARRDRS